MVMGRDELVSALFSETDRAQRMRTPLALIEVGIDGCGLESGRNCCDEAVEKIVGRIRRLLRCYDTVGRMAEEELAIVLPGCTTFNAKTLAERVRDEVFRSPVTACGTTRLNACYGVAGSGGRSPFVVMQEVERALRSAKAKGSGAIVCASQEADMDLVAFLMPVSGDESLRW